MIIKNFFVHNENFQKNAATFLYIFFVSGNQSFNRGCLFNVGFKEIFKYNNWQCVVFHDVDLIPLDDRILYTCPSFPRHMCGTVVQKENL